MTPAKKRADEPTEDAKKAPAKAGAEKTAAKPRSKAADKDAETEVKTAAKAKAADTKPAEASAETKVAAAGDAEPKKAEPNKAAAKAAPSAESNGRQAGGPKPRGERKVREGMVVSDRMDKTIVVTLEDRVKHPLYGKVIRRTSKVKAHDEQNSAGIGDRVRLMETRPLSATKRWRLVEIVERAK